MNKGLIYHFAILIILVLLSCNKKKGFDCEPSFFRYYSADQIKYTGQGYHFIFKCVPWMKNGLCGYNIICSINNNKLQNQYTPFEFYGFIFKKDNYLYTIPLFTDKVIPIVSFNKNETFFQCIPVNNLDTINIMKTGVVKSGYKAYHENIFLYRFFNIVPAFERKNGDMVMFLSQSYGPVGLYFSVVTNDTDGNETEIIYNIQGDILLSETNYEGINLGINNFRKINQIDSISKSKINLPVDNRSLPDKRYYKNYFELNEW